MNRDTLSASYRGYIECLNQQDWKNLGRYVSENVSHNGKTLGLSGYRAMLEGDFAAIPDLYFNRPAGLTAPAYRLPPEIQLHPHRYTVRTASQWQARAFRRECLL